MGGGIFYGLKIWQGTALGCPEPIISEVHQNTHDILPYHAHFSSSDSYPGPPPDYGGGNSYPSAMGGGGSYSGVYSNTPGPQYLPPSYAGAGVQDAGAGPGQQYLPPSYASAGADASAGGGATAPGGGYTRRGGNGRALDENAAGMFTDLMFRFLNVNSDECKKRFVCEMELRNPFMGYAFRYIG